MLALLANKGPKIAPFVITTIVQLTTRICKLAWFDDPSHQEIVEEILKFLKVYISLCLLCSLSTAFWKLLLHWIEVI
jgi:hypothetical protein